MKLGVFTTYLSGGVVIKSDVYQDDSPAKIAFVKKCHLQIREVHHPELLWEREEYVEYSTSG